MSSLNILTILYNLSVLADVGIQMGLYENVVPLNQLI